jgi:hypothetical protein
MDNQGHADHIRQARAAYAARRLDARSETNPSRNDGSPVAVEAALARISQEVTAEAVERRRDESKRGKNGSAPP